MVAFQESVQQQVNLLTTFKTLLVKEEAAQAADPQKPKKKDAITVTDAQCRT
ncbi:MAG: hypothetical protein Q8N17_06395 [Burkholderiaceae bacterium]|nr:hypothetical protein [Burkholderiaceae bacterium]